MYRDILKKGVVHDLTSSKFSQEKQINILIFK
jgi:hypothetical protein